MTTLTNGAMTSSVRWALMQEPKHTLWKLVLLLLAVHANEVHKAVLYRREIAAMAGCSSRSVDNAIAGLEGLGLITRQRRGSDRCVFTLQLTEGRQA